MSRDHPTDRAALRRVRALLAKAESTPFPDEAAALSAKAHQIMTANALDRLLVDESRTAGVTRRQLVVPSPYVRSKFLLLSVVADAGRCRAVLHRGGAPATDGGESRCSVRDRCATVVGHDDDLDDVDLLYTSLLLQAVNAMLARGSVWSVGGVNRTRSFRNSFLVGFAHEVESRLAESRQCATEHPRHADLLPVLAGRASAVDARVDELFPHLEGMTASVSSLDGLADGHRAGQRADLGRRRVSASRQLNRGSP